MVKKLEASKGTNSLSRLIDFYDRKISDNKEKIILDKFNINLLYINIFETFKKNNNKKKSFEALFSEVFYLYKKCCIKKDNNFKVKPNFDDEFSVEFKDIIVNNNIFVRIIHDDKLYIKIDISKIDSYINKKKKKRFLKKKFISKNFKPVIKHLEEKSLVETISSKEDASVIELTEETDNTTNTTTTQKSQNTPDKEEFSEKLFDENIKFNFDKNTFKELTRRAKIYLENIKVAKSNLEILETKVKIIIKKLFDLLNSKSECNKLKDIIIQKENELSNLYDLMSNEAISLKILFEIKYYEKNLFDSHINSIKAYKSKYIDCVYKLKTKMEEFKKIEDSIILNRKEINECLRNIKITQKNIINYIAYNGKSYNIKKDKSEDKDTDIKEGVITGKFIKELKSKFNCLNDELKQMDIKL